MQTINGTIELVTGSPAGPCDIVIIPRSTPQPQGGGLLTGNSQIGAAAAADGTFSFQLRPGVYDVEFRTPVKDTKLKIQVTASSGTASLTDLIISELPEIPEAYGVRFTTKGLELRYPDGTWHSFIPVILNGQYLVDTDQNPS